MNTDTPQIDPGSKGTDFQPTTQNPQQIGGGNVQSSTADVQSSGNGSTGQELYQRAERQENLTVKTDSYSANSLVSVKPSSQRSNDGLVTVTGALVILLIIVAIISYYSRQKPIVNAEQSDTEIEPVQPVIVPVAPVVPKKKKKPANKKKKSSKRK